MNSNKKIIIISDGPYAGEYRCDAQARAAFDTLIGPALASAEGGTIVRSILAGTYNGRLIRVDPMNDQRGTCRRELSNC